MPDREEVKEATQNITAANTHIEDIGVVKWLDRVLIWGNTNSCHQHL